MISTMTSKNNLKSDSKHDFKHYFKNDCGTSEGKSEEFLRAGVHTSFAMRLMARCVWWPEPSGWGLAGIPKLINKGSQELTNPEIIDLGGFGPSHNETEILLDQN